MLYYLLGIITGAIFSFIFLLVALWTKPKLERQIKQFESRMKEKGKIFDPEETEELEEWIDNLEEK